MSFLSIDFETRSACDLKKAGAYVYAKHPTTDIWCMAWAFEGEEPAIWTPGTPLPMRVTDHIAAGGEVRAWNAPFERVIWRAVMEERYGAPPIVLAQWTDTAAEAAAMALPRGLGNCAKALGLEEQKDSEGYNLMLRMARPRRLTADGTPEWWDVPDRVARLHSYCQQDVRAEMAIVPKLRRLNATERAVWEMDQRMNDRGIRVDLTLVEAAKAIADEGIRRANVEIAELTDGAVTKVSQSGRLRAWLTTQGVETVSVSKAAVKDLLETEITHEVRRAIEARAEAGRSSVKKLDAALDCADPDDWHARGLLKYHAASTGRWAGALFQPQNIARPEDADPERFIADVLAGDYEMLDLVKHPVAIVVDLLRSLLTARPGHELVAGDFSAIEAVVLNWLADEREMLEHFRAYFAGDKTRDPYIQNAMRLYRLPFAEIKKHPHRQTGKFQELGCGFQMGAGKAVSAAKDVYGLLISPEEAKEIVNGYRSTHPRVVSLWAESERTAIESVENPGRPVVFGGRRNLKWVTAGGYLHLVLPSGRLLHYAAPRVELAPTPWGSEKATVVVSAVDSYTKQWGRLKLYGGLIVENAVQATARDIMADRMLACELAGYAPVLTVHDEIVTEVPVGFGSIAEFDTILRDLPEWAEELPINSESWRGFRYRK